MAHHQHDELTLQQTLNIPQLVVSLVLTALIARWVYTWLAGNGDGSASSAALNARGANAAAAARRRVDDRHIEQVQAVFPQFNRREIYWDLMRNGGRVEATTERILTGRGLDSPPPAFQPPPAPGDNGTATAAGTFPSSTAADSARSMHPDLITRYNLSSKIPRPSESGDGSSSGIGSRDDDEEGRGGGQSKDQTAWNPSRHERQAILQRRREEMILSARRKILEKDREKAKQRS